MRPIPEEASPCLGQIRFLCHILPDDRSPINQVAGAGHVDAKTKEIKPARLPVRKSRVVVHCDTK